MLRISSGQYRSRLLLTPGDESTRPMAARVKESIFNLLRGWFDGTTVLDIFAGVGTMGLEAASLGAARVVMVERQRDVVQMLQRNIDSLGCGDRVTILPGDALAASTLAAVPKPVDVVFMDPPYALMTDEANRERVLAQAARCRGLMGDKGFLVLRTPLDPSEVSHAIPGFDGPEIHRYGQEMWVLLYAPAAAGPADGPTPGPVPGPTPGPTPGPA